MTHFQILLRELVKYGQTTYPLLARRYGRQGYNRAGFAAAVHRARQDGVVAPAWEHGQTIVKAAGAECPCCGREL